MNVVCEVCGDVGFKHLLLSCSDCQGGHTHQYCLDKILYDASSVDWFCKECDQRHSEDGKVSSERLSSDVHFVTTPQQPVTKRLESARVFGPRGQWKHAYLKKKYSSRMNYLRKKLIRKNTNMEGMAISRRRCRDASIAGTRVSALHSCEVIGTETTKNKDRNDQVDNEKSVQTLNNDHGSNSLTPGLKQINQLKPHNNISSERPESQTAPFEGFFMKTKKVVSGSLNPIIEEGNTEREKSGEKSKCMNERKILAEALERSMVAANGPQPFTPQNGTFDKAMSDLSNMGVLPKENNCLPHIENGSVKENHCGLLDQDNSTPSVKISSKAIALEVSATEVEISHDVENFGKDKPRKRRLLILDDDDEVDDEKAEDVQKENVNPQPPKYDAPMTKHRVDTEYFVEETVQTGELNDQNLINGRPVKRRRRYIAENEDEEEIVESDNVECALNDATNQSLNDGANMVPQTLVATDHSQQSRPSHSEYDDQEYYIYSQPLDEPVWSGVFKIDSEVLMLDAHLSSKACDRVRELSTSLRSVVEVKKLPRSQAWPKSWTSFGPTDDNIGLFFFPNSLRQNEVSNRLVNNIIKSDGALKVAVGMAELLIFPSSLLPKEYHFFQGNHYLWGVFRRRKDMADETVLGKEQDGSVKNATEQGHRQEPGLLNQRDEALYESSDQETCAVKHVVHIDNQLPVECDHKVEKEAAKAATREGTPGSSWSSAKMNSPKVGSNSCVEPRNDSKLDVHGDLDQQEDVTSLLVNGSSIMEQSSDSGPAAVSTNGQPHSGSEPSTRKLFGFVTARTPRSQQLIQEMVSEGALLFPVPEEVVTTGSIPCISTSVVSSEMNPNIERLHLSEPPQAFDFVSMGHCEPGADSEACLELFPVRQEHIGWAPKADVSREVDLDLSLGKQSRAPSLPPLL